MGINKKSCIACSVLEHDKQQKINEPDKIAVLKLLVRLVFVVLNHIGNLIYGLCKLI